MTLYEMTEAAKSLLALLESGEIDEQVFADTMESIGAEEKLESYIYIQRQLESEIAAFEAEIERMQERKHALEKNVARMKAAQVAYMQAAGVTKAKAGTFTLSLRTSKACDITDESAVPREFWREIPADLKLDKKAILAALKEGKEIAGAKLKETTSVIAR